MGKTLIIAEKPSVAGDISKALGKFEKNADFYENDQYVISSAVGHLLTIAVPEQFEVKRGKWTFANLPVIPPHFDLLPIEKNEARLKVLTKLIKRKDVTALVNACDAGREGELIFRYIVQYSKSDKPIQRLWLQSMTPAAIRDGFAHLRTDVDMMPLADAATCRSESDWLIGINGTRAMTAFNSKTVAFISRRLAVCRRRRWQFSSSAKRRLKSLFRATTGKFTEPLRRQRVNIPAAGLMRSFQSNVVARASCP